MPPGTGQGAYNAVKQSLSLFSPFNKVSDAVDGQGQPDVIAEYRSTMDDVELIQLKSKWKRDYAEYYRPLEKLQETNYQYWLGNQGKQTIEDMMDANRQLVDNEIFIGLETFLPIATRANPDPLVTVDQSTGDQTLADLVRNSLSYQADRQKLRMLLKGTTRDWALFKLGAIKLRWDKISNDIATEVVNPRRLILDPDGYVKEGGIFTGDYIGELKMVEASTLIRLFPDKKDIILSKSGGKQGTKLQVEEWWYKKRDYFFTLGDTVLGKYKNHLWNYDGTDPNTGQEIVGRNHLEEPCDPYIFMGGVYSTRTQPHDDTTPIQQILPVQDLINRRFRQIDKNAEATNNGIVVNGNLNSEQASLAAEAVRKGGAIRIPDKDVDVRTAVMRLPAPNLAPIVQDNLDDARQMVSGIFGTSGSTPEAVNDTDTVRGKILINQLDATRIGGGVSEFIEQVADTWYNKVLQIMYVYYDVPHYAAAVGLYGAQEIIQLKNSDLIGKIMVTVKEGSMVPKDPLTLRNQAIDLWKAQGIDPINLGKYLEMPDPYEYAKNLLMWQMIQKGALPPQMMFPDFQVPAVQTPAPTGVATSPVAQQNVVNPAPPQASAPAVAQESQQLVHSIPIH